MIQQCAEPGCSALVGGPTKRCPRHPDPQEAASRRAADILEPLRGERLEHEVYRVLEQRIDAELATLAARLARSEREHAVVEAVLYAMREGCFFPVPEPKGGETTKQLIQWGAIRNLHAKVAALTPAPGRGHA